VVDLLHKQAVLVAEQQHQVVFLTRVHLFLLVLAVQVMQETVAREAQQQVLLVVTE
jgi:hypothetical protein